MSDKKIRCVLIDDDLDDQEIFLLGIEKTGLNIECLTANDGLQGLALLEKQSTPPDYIFLDLNMPNMDGKKCLVEIKKQERLNAVPVIMYSTSSYINDIRETRRLGATGFITKPTNVGALVDLLMKIFTKTYSFESSAYYQ
jgi:CheY-like chemotaxis protein